MTARDREATLALIEHYGSADIQGLLNDRSTKTKQVFEIIAGLMAVQGFLISGDAWKAGERCFQKWRNMERTYRDYVLAQRKTDAGRRKQPEFFEQFHALMGQRLSSKLATVAASSLPQGAASESSKTDGSPTPLYTIVVPASSSTTVGIPSNAGSEAENCVQAGTTETHLGRKWTKDRVLQTKLLQSHGQKDSEAERRVQKAKRRSLLGESKGRSVIGMH